MPQFGEYFKPEILHNNPGTVKPVSPYVPPAVGKAQLPDNLNWLRPFCEEMKDQLINRVFKRVMKVFMPYYYFPPFYHVPVDMYERVLVPAGAVNQMILHLPIPQDQMARIKFYGQDITAVPPFVLPGTEWQEVTWTFSVNGAPLNYYSNFLGQRGVLNLAPAETTIVLDGSDVFSISVTNTSVNDYFIWASIQGWQWSKLSTPLPDGDMLEDK